MRASAPRAFLPAIVVLGLVAVVAIAATGSTRGGSDETRRPSDIVLDTFFTFALLALVPARRALDLRAHATKGDRPGGRFGQVPTEQRAPVVHHPRRLPSRSIWYFRPPSLVLAELRTEKDAILRSRAARTEARATRLRGERTSRSSPGSRCWWCWRSSPPESAPTSSRNGGGSGCSAGPSRSWPERPPTCWTTSSTTCVPSRTLDAP